MRQAVIASAMALYLLGAPIRANNVDAQSRILHGNLESTVDPKGTYEQGMQAVSNYQYEDAEHYFERAFRYGLSNPDFMRTNEWRNSRDWLTKKLWEDVAEQYPLIINAEQAVVDIELDRAEQLPKDSQRRKEELAKAKAHQRSIKDKQTYLQKALDRLGRK